MDLKQEVVSAAQITAGLATSALVMTGIAGTIYKVLSPGGWIAEAFGRSVKAGFTVLLAVALLVAFAYISRTWAPSHKRRNFTANVVVAAFAVAGLAYLVDFWTTGRL